MDAFPVPTITTQSEYQMVTDLQNHILEYKKTIEDLTEQVLEAKRSLIQFKGLVRQKAIDVREQQNWCLDGLNSALDDLGLEPHYERWSATVTVTFSIYDIEAADEDQATDAASEAIGSVFEYGTDFNVDCIDVEPES